MKYKSNNKSLVKLQTAWTTMPTIKDAFNRAFARQSTIRDAEQKAKKQVASEKPKYTFINPYDITRGWREATEDAAKQDKYTVQNLGGSKEEAQKAYDNTWKNSRRQLAATTTQGLLMAPMLGELSTYGLLGGGLRIGTGWIGSKAGEYVLGKGGDWADKKLNTNFLGTTGRIIGGLGGWWGGASATTPLFRNLAGKGITLHMPQETFMNLRGQYFDNAANKISKNFNTGIIKNYTVYHGGEFLGDVPLASKGDEFGFHVSADKNVAQQLVNRGVSGANKTINKNKGVVREGILTTIGEPIQTFDWGTWGAYDPSKLFNGPKGFKFNRRFLKRKGITYSGLEKDYQKEFWKPEIAAKESEANANFARLLKEHGIQAIEYPNVHEGSSINKSFAIIDPSSIVLDKHYVHIPSAPKYISTYHFDPRATQFKQLNLPEIKPYQIERYPGYMLKSLMEGNPLEKQLSKIGTVNVNNIRAIVSKGSKVDQAVVDKILASEEFAGKKSIDYNKFRKAVQDELITYERTPNAGYKRYGMDRLGFNENFDVFRAQDFLEENPDLPWHVHRNPTTDDIVFTRRKMKDDGVNSYIEIVPQSEVDATYGKWLEKHNLLENDVSSVSTYTFSSPRIPNGSSKHYDANTLGHSRTYTTVDEPNVLHVMESQSDWAQNVDKTKLGDDLNITSKFVEESTPLGDFGMDRTNIFFDGETGRYTLVNPGEGIPTDVFWKQHHDAYKKQVKLDFPTEQAKHLIDNYTYRQIQENLRYAAEKGLTKMRYPTRETAAKIEGYPEREAYFDAQGNDITTKGTPEMWSYGEQQDKELQYLRKAIKDLEEEYDTWVQNDKYVRNGLDRDETARAISNDLREAQSSRNNIINKNEPKLAKGYSKKTVYDYEDILRKYTEFPKQYQKLYKNADVRIVTDSNGNTWYEVDVPKNYLQQEWQFKQGGILKAQPGTIIGKSISSQIIPKKLFELVAKRSNAAQVKDIPTIIGDVITGRDKSFYNEDNINGSNEIDTYLYGKPYNSEFTGDTSVGPDYTNYINKNYPGKNIKTYNAHFGDTLYIDNKAKNLVEKQLNNGDVVGGSMGRYSHAPSYIFNTEDGRPYDAGGHLMKFSRDKDGKIVANMSDIYDFNQKDFDEKYDQTENSYLVRVIADKIGKPFIVRQNNIPVRFKEIVPEYKTEAQRYLGDFLSSWGNMYDLTLPLRLTDNQINEIFDGREYGDEILNFMKQKGYIK